MGFPDHTLRMAVLDFVNSSSDKASEKNGSSHFPLFEQTENQELFTFHVLLFAACPFDGQLTSPYLLLKWF